LQVEGRFCWITQRGETAGDARKVVRSERMQWAANRFRVGDAH
jgi:hypothetical protein